MANDRLAIRLHPGSAALAVAHGPVAQRFGVTKRLNDVCQRYAIMLANEVHGIDPLDMALIAERLRLAPSPWPIYSRQMMRVMLAEAAQSSPADMHATVNRINHLTHPQIIALAEDCEEWLAQT